MALWIAVLLYLALTLPQLHLPGLHYDEAKEAGLNAMEMLLRQDVHAFRSAGVQVGSLFFPLMVQDYIGALNVYLGLPLLAIVGVTVPALRLVGVLCGLGTLLLARGLGDELASLVRQPPAGANETQTRDGAPGVGWIGTLAALLLAVSPAFVFWSRQGIFVTNVVVTLAVAVVWTGLRWLRTGRPAALYVMAFLAGLGLWAKLLFVWVLGAMAGVLLAGWLLGRLAKVDFGLNAAAQPSRSRLRSIVIAALLFAAALTPLLLYNQQTAGTFRSVFGNLGQSYYGVQNAAFVDNLAVRLEQVVTLLRGDFLWYLGGPFANGLAPALAGGILAIALIATLIDGRARRNRVALPVLLLALFFVVLLVVQSSFTVSGLFITHYAILQPFVVLLVALAASCGWRVAASRWQASQPGMAVSTRRPFAWLAAMAVIVFALGLWFAVDLTTTVRYHAALAQNGGQVTHSDAIYRLAAWLDEHAVKQPVALDWGIDAPVRYLTENRVEPVEIFGYDRLDAPDPGFEQRAAQFLADPTRLYILRMPEDTVFAGRREALEALAARLGTQLAVVEAFYDRSGKTMFVLVGAGG